MDKITKIKEILKEVRETGFNWRQINEIELGLKKKLDVSKYADPKFNDDQMREIRFGLEQGLDVGKYADPKFHWTQMYEISRGLSHNIDVSKYADPKLDSFHMGVIRYNLEKEKKEKAVKKKEPELKI